ncbi:MAG: selenocysteine-specific translation elongation factor [Chloroflexota bacterium]
MMYVIGTAGHVDHGKSSLVKALTGIDPDRLAEEKEREMTIDLGFAWLKLGEEEVGVVDVPGHRDFIENMLAGVGGIDLALFVVAADEGVMPQTREHLAILDLLEVQGGVVALTKTDLVEQANGPAASDWLELVTLDVSEELAGTVLADAPIVPVSARTGQGLNRLKAALLERLAATTPRLDSGRPRLPIDRVFTLAGFGTIVTGTLIGGSLQSGDAVEIQPAGLKGRVRGLQTHKTKLQVARPGSRVAVNLTGVNKEEVKRGDVVAGPGVVRGTVLLDASYRHLSDAGDPLQHNEEVKLFTGAAEVVAHARVLGAQQVKPGERGWLQLALAEPVAVSRGDHFIMRRPSPGQTLGGGQVLDPHPGRRHRRFRPEVTQRLQTLAQGAPADLLRQKLLRLEPVSLAELLRQANLDEKTALAAWNDLVAAGQVVSLEEHVLSRQGWGRLVERIQAAVTDYQREFPLRQGMPREELRSRLRLPAALFSQVITRLVGDGQLVEQQAAIYTPDHEVRLSDAQRSQIEQLMRRFELLGVNSLSVKECKAAVGDELYYLLVGQGRLRPLNEEVVYTAAEYDKLTAAVLAYLRQHGRINAAQVRDLFSTSRRYAIALLEHLDELRLTRRVGDERVIGKMNNGQ